MNKKDTERFREMLLKEKTELETELESVGRRVSGSVGGWEATAKDMEVDTADENEVADKLEELEENSGIVDQLEKQLGDVVSALERIDKGVYGLCDICGEPIELERLEANPSSRISIKHKHQK